METMFGSNGSTTREITPPLALFDASHGQPNWAQTGFTSREMHSNLAGLTEILCRLGFKCCSTSGDPLSPRLSPSPGSTEQDDSRSLVDRISLSPNSEVKKGVALRKGLWA